MRTILLNLPYDCRGYIINDPNTGEESCVLNARLSHEDNIKTYQHERRHVKNGDLHCSEDVNGVEYRCHKNR